MVGPEAMEKFCEDIGVEPENVSQITFVCVTLNFKIIGNVKSHLNLTENIG